MRAVWWQTLWLTLATALFTWPRLIREGTNAVTWTYAQAAERFFQGISPYLDPGRGDWFKYSPFFAQLYAPIGALPENLEAPLWALLNALVFWSGISRFFLFTRKTSAWLWGALLLASMELDVSIRYQQVNALIAGLILWGVADYRDGKYFRSGFWLTLATNFKVFPLPIALGLLFPWRRRYAQGLIATSIVCLLAPAIVWGLEGTWRLHADWALLLLRDVQSAGLLDIESVLTRHGWPDLGTTLRACFLAGSLAAPLFRPHQWLSICLLGLLLTNPRTESPTFVLAAPVYLFLTDALRAYPSRWRVLCLSIAAGITLVYTDLWPKSVWDPRETFFLSKTLGVLALEVLALKVSLSNQG